MEYGLADFLQFFKTNIEICLLYDQLSIHHQIQAFQQFS